MYNSEWNQFQDALRSRIGVEGLESVNRLITESNLDQNLIILCDDYRIRMNREGLLDEFEGVCRDLNITFRQNNEPER